MLELPSRPPIASAPLSVVLVAEAASPINDGYAIVAAWSRQLDKLKRPWELLIVTDLADETTRQRLAELAVTQPNVRHLHDPARRGYGPALQSGISAAQHPLVCCATFDTQYAPADLPALLEKIDAVDIVTGYRTGRPVPGLLRGLRLVYRLAARVLLGLTIEPVPCWLGWRAWTRRAWARVLFGLRLHDVECAFRLYRRAIFDRIPIQSTGRFAEVEILAKANFLGCYLDQVPVRAEPRRLDRAGFFPDLRQLVRNADFGPARPTPPVSEPAPPAPAPTS